MVLRMDRRALPGLFGGLAGCTFAVAGAILPSPSLTVVAAACALLAGASSLALLERARLAEQRAAIAVAELATLREIEQVGPAARAHRARSRDRPARRPLLRGRPRHPHQRRPPPPLARHGRAPRVHPPPGAPARPEPRRVHDPAPFDPPGSRRRLPHRPPHVRPGVGGHERGRRGLGGRAHPDRARPATSSAPRACRPGSPATRPTASPPARCWPGAGALNRAAATDAGHSLGVVEVAGVDLT